MTQVPRIMRDVHSLAGAQPTRQAIEPRSGRCLACGCEVWPPHPERRNIPPNLCAECRRGSRAESRAKPDLPHPGPKSTLGDRLHWARLRRGLSQEQLAKAAGRYASQVVRWERHGTRTVQVDVLLALAQALRVPLSALLGPVVTELETHGCDP